VRRASKQVEMAIVSHENRHSADGYCIISSREIIEPGGHVSWVFSGTVGTTLILVAFLMPRLQTRR
jgi:hypothetical protein